MIYGEFHKLFLVTCQKIVFRACYKWLFITLINWQPAASLHQLHLVLQGHVTKARNILYHISFNRFIKHWTSCSDACSNSRCFDPVEVGCVLSCPAVVVRPAENTWGRVEALIMLMHKLLEINRERKPILVFEDSA